MEKMTKREKYVAIVEVVEAAGREDLVQFCRDEIDALDRKAAKAKERAAKKKAETDELYDAVLAVLTHEFQLTAEIVDQIGLEDVSAAKVQARLRKMIEAGLAVKDDIKVEGQKGTKKGYKLA